MIQIILKELQEINTERSNKLLSIFNNTQSEVEESFYATTIFESFPKYISTLNIFSSQVEGELQRRLVETPLSFIRGKETAIFKSSPKQGIDFGGVLFHYVTKKPLIIFTVTKSSTGYVYNSSLYKEEENAYVDRISVNLTKTSLDKFYKSFFKALSEDVSNWEK